MKAAKKIISDIQLQQKLKYSNKRRNVYYYELLLWFITMIYYYDLLLFTILFHVQWCNCKYQQKNIPLIKRSTGEKCSKQWVIYFLNGWFLNSNQLCDIIYQPLIWNLSTKSDLTNNSLAVLQKFSQRWTKLCYWFLYIEMKLERFFVTSRICQFWSGEIKYALPSITFEILRDFTRNFTHMYLGDTRENLFEIFTWRHFRIFPIGSWALLDLRPYFVQENELSNEFWRTKKLDVLRWRHLLHINYFFGPSTQT